MESYAVLTAALAVMYIVKTLIVNDLTYERARSKIDNGAVIIDVRTEEEFAQSSIEGALNIPLQQIGQNIERAVPDRNKDILLYCRSGSRSFMARRSLKKMDYANVYNLGSFGRAKRIVQGRKV